MISLTEDQIFKVKEAQVTIIKNNYAILNEMKKDNATCEAIMKDKFSNEEVPVTNIENPNGQQAHELEKQYSKPFPSDKQDEDIRECNCVPLRVDEEIQDPTLVKQKKNANANEEEQHP